jgi:hypothetical protein
VFYNYIFIIYFSVYRRKQFRCISPQFYNTFQGGNFSSTKKKEINNFSKKFNLNDYYQKKSSWSGTGSTQPREKN